MFVPVTVLGSSKKPTKVVFLKDWMGFKEGQDFTLFEKDALGLERSGIVMLKDSKVIKKKVKEPEDQPKLEQKEFKRPPQDKMIKGATISK